MSNSVRLRVSKTGTNYIARSKLSKNDIEAKSETELWDKIKNEYGVNRKMKRKGVWICTEDTTIEESKEKSSE